MRTLINVRIPCSSRFVSDQHLWKIGVDENEKIVFIDLMSNGKNFNSEDWQGDWLSPRGVDLQINGGLGISFNELDINNIPKIIDLLDQLWIDGVEAIAPTLVSCSLSALRRALEVLRLVRKQNSHLRCKLLGAHLEGPFLSEVFKGAHDVNSLTIPSLFALEERIRSFEEEISIVTLAPELVGASDVIKRLRSLGIFVSLGHAAANFEASQASFELGVGMLTHVFNAMPGLNHKDPGPIGAALIQGEVAMGLIADGTHVHPAIAVMIQKLAADQLFIVSDALAPYGLNQRKFEWNKRKLIIDNGVCKLEHGTLAGTTIPLLEACKRIACWTNEPSWAIWAATVSPRFVFKEKRETQELLIGKSLKGLLRWNFNFQSKSLNWNQAK